MMGPLALLGGTFDPVHVGHLASACAARDLLGCEVRMVPSRTPPHRGQPTASAADRLAMLELAVRDERGISVDDRELRRAGPSYTYDTLASIRAEEGERRSLVFVLGRDAFITLPQWRRWRELRRLCHLLVLARPGLDQAGSGPSALGEAEPVQDETGQEALADERVGERARVEGGKGAAGGGTLGERAPEPDDVCPPALAAWAGECETSDHRVLLSAPSGRICVKELVQVKVSSTEVRRTLAGCGGLPQAWLRASVPAKVLAYIASRRLYGVGGA